MHRHLSVFVFVLLALLPTTAPADAQDEAGALRRPSSAINIATLDRPTYAGFDPGDPRVGLILIAAYAPSPLLVLDRVASEQNWGRAFTIVEIITAAIGLGAATWGLFESFGQGAGADIAFGSIATAHALAWNLQLMTNALSRLAVGVNDGTPQPWLPTFMAFPAYGGAGVLVRWEN